MREDTKGHREKRWLRRTLALREGGEYARETDSFNKRAELECYRAREPRRAWKANRQGKMQKVDSTLQINIY
jgi:hypothetical protein